MNTQENNRILAEFMGCENDGNGMFLIPGWGWDKPENFKFRTSWDWLMQVVEKIESLGFNVTIKGITCNVSPLLSDETIVQWVLGERSRKIELVYIAVASFVIWYNEQNK